MAETFNKIAALAMPFRSPGKMCPNAVALGVRAMASTSGKIDIAPGMGWTSLLPYTFNLLWTGFLNARSGVPVQLPNGGETVRPVDYFAMIHDDIHPDPGWLDVLIEELEANDADIVSAVVPIKDNYGLTSTGVDSTGDEWNPRRLTMTEVFELPPTFGDADVGGQIVLNTGLWVCKFTRPWCEKVWFRQHDEVRRNADGTFEAHTRPEDWDFSRQVRAHGGKLLATRKVGLNHESVKWTNRKPWGQWKTDELTLKSHPNAFHKAA